MASTASTPQQQQQFTELTDYILPPLSNVDHANPFVKTAIVTTATLTSVLVYVMTQAFFVRVSPLYRNLRLKEKVFWNLAVVRSVFGVLCIVVGVWGIFCDTALNRDVVLATSPTSHVAADVTVGFFIFECLALTASDVYFRTFSHLLQVHHWISLVGFVVVLVTDAGHAFAVRGLTLEMTTPFSCLCWTLLKAGRERSLLWKANQFLLVHTFHLRNVVELMIWYVTYQNWDNVWAHMPLALFVTLYGQLVLVTFFMTPFWTLKKTRQLICPVDWNFESEEIDVDAPGQAQSQAQAQAQAQARSYNNGTVVVNGAVHSESVNGYPRLMNGSGSGIKEE
ncbi:protein CLN8-like [Babylonia areolata]|uniref:protein CLN8-like n=1 Tax=Babylonia areolata TaxID=304850 RepID=UPI003FCF1157